MNPGEHEVMSRVEETHWWYRGLRDVITRCLREPRFQLPPSPHVLDAGCGTGQNLKILGELLQPAYLGGFDISEVGLGFARQKTPGADLYQSDLANPSLHVDELDLAVSLDVICLPGVERAREAGVGRPYFCRMVRLGFLAPDVVKAVLTNRHPPQLTAKRLALRIRLPIAWEDQVSALGIT